MLLRKLIFSLLIIGMAGIYSCRDYKESILEDVEIYHILEDSTVELFQVDSIVIRNVRDVYFYFNIDTTLLNMDNVHKVIIYKNGELSHRLPDGEYGFFVDLNVPQQELFQYQFGLQDPDLDHSPLSEVYEVYIP